jgi:hypothetical protein
MGGSGVQTCCWYKRGEDREEVRGEKRGRRGGGSGEENKLIFW